MKKLALFLAAATVASSVVAIPSVAVADITPSDKVLKVSFDDIEIDGVIDGAYLSSYHVEHEWQDYKDGDPNNKAESNWNHWECGVYEKKTIKRDENGFQVLDENGVAVEIDNPDYTPYPYDDPEKCVRATSYFLWDPEGYLFVAIDVFDPTAAVVSDAKYDAECLNIGAPFGPWLQDQVMPQFGIDSAGKIMRFQLSAERGGRYAHLFSHTDVAETWTTSWKSWDGHEDNGNLNGLFATTQRANGYTVELVIPVDLAQANFNSTIKYGPAFGEDGYKVFYSLILFDALDLGTGDDDFKNYGVDPAQEQEGIIATGTNFVNFSNFTSGASLVDSSPALQLVLSNEEPTNVHEHDWQVVEGTNTATCSKTGFQTLFCEGCGLYSSEETPTIPHTWEAEKTVDLQPSCVADGSKSYHCKECGAIDPDSVEAIPALGGQHTYDPNAEKVIDKEATCEEAGSKSHHCDVCGFSVEDTIETIPALGHDMGEAVVVNPTCTEAGSSTRSCSRCDHKEVEVIEALGHSYGEAVVVDATCTKAGTSTVKCERCGDEQVTIIEALGHDFVDGVCTRCGEHEDQPNPDVIGDVNGDKVVNSKDLTRLMKYIAGDPDAKLEGNGDINDDGKVNSKDLTRLMKIIAGADLSE